MSEIHDPHDAKDQRQPDAEQRISAAEDQHVNYVLEVFSHRTLIKVKPRRPVGWSEHCYGKNVVIAMDCDDHGRPAYSFGSTTFALSTLIRYTLGMLWPLSLPAGPCFSNLILPFSPISSVSHSALVIASGSALPAFSIATAMVRMPS